MDPTSSIFNTRNIVATLVLVAVIAGGFLFWKEKTGLTNSELGEKIATETVRGIQKGVNAPGALIAKVESNNAQLSIAGVLRGTNGERANQNLPLLVNNASLNRVAEIRMLDMFEKGYFEHVSPQGQSASLVAEQVGYEYVTVGENIAMGNFATDDVLVKAWMDSPGHRENILRDVYTEIGIAVAKKEYQGKVTWIAVQIFAKPLSDCPEISVEMKRRIENEVALLDQKKAELATLAAQMESFKSSGRWDEYNARVSEYNQMVAEINNRGSALQAQMSEYNVSVRAFNACIAN